MPYGAEKGTLEEEAVIDLEDLGKLLGALLAHRAPPVFHRRNMALGNARQARQLELTQGFFGAGRVQHPTRTLRLRQRREGGPPGDRGRGKAPASTAMPRGHRGARVGPTEGKLRCDPVGVRTCGQYYRFPLPHWHFCTTKAFYSPFFLQFGPQNYRFLPFTEIC
jgi:hypothetical protein